MKKKLIISSIILCVSLIMLPVTHAAIVTVNFDPAPGSVLDSSVQGVGVFEFDVITDDPSIVFNWGGALVGSWFNFDAPPNPAQATSFGGTAEQGVLATISYDETLYTLSLNNFLLKDPNIPATTYVLGTDYLINPNGPTTYTISSVPIPPTVLLLGAGLLGLVGIRRRVKS